MALWKACMLVLLLYSLHVQGTAYSTVLAQENAVFYATKQYYDSTIFNAPRNGTINGVTLTYKTGGVSCKGCSKNQYKNLTYWGCKEESHAPSRFHVMLMHITNPSNYYGDLYYPQISTQVCSCLYRYNNVYSRSVTITYETGSGVGASG